MDISANRRYLAAMAELVALHKHAHQVMTEDHLAKDMDVLRDLCACFYSRYRLEPGTLLRCIEAVIALYPEATQAEMRKTVEEILRAPLSAFAPGGSRSLK